MVLLRRVKLINWHFFNNTVVDLGMSTLLAGDNGTGKSTIIDAVQYALVADIRKIQFNAAAAQARASRTLESYCRCKIGSSSLEYHRGDTISHVILEFDNTKGHSGFCAGIMVEAAKGGETKELPWIWDNSRLEDIRIFDGPVFLTRRQFRDFLKDNNAFICATKREYSSRLTHLLKVHKRNVDFNPYLSALVRSVSFTPFTSVDQFVCNYILEERHVDLSAMKENLLNYKDAESQAYVIKAKIGDLETIKAKQEECETIAFQMLRQQYLRYKVTSEMNRLKILEKEQEILDKNRELKAIHMHHETLLEQKHSTNDILQELTVAFARNEKRMLYDRLERRRQELEEKRAVAEKRKDRFFLLKKQCEAALDRELNESLAEEKAGLTNRIDDNKDHIISDRQLIETILDSLRDAEKEKKELERGMLRYPAQSIELRQALEAEEITAWIFADLLEIFDSGWQNAVEGWLNTQRFNILVYEADFQKALEIYNGLPKKIAGVGIPNLGKMKDFIIEEGTIAEVVHSDSPLAARYIAFLLGDVHMAGIETLKDHPRSITRECMKYSSHTASRIKEEIYSRWYIGKAAREKRMREIESLIDKLTTDLGEKKRRLQSLEEVNRLLIGAHEAIIEMFHLEDSLRQVEMIGNELKTLARQISEIDTSEFESLKQQIDSIKREIRKIEGELEVLNRDIGKTDEYIEGIKISKASLEEQAKEDAGNLARFEEENIAFKKEFTAYYSERIKKGATIGIFEKILANYEPALRGMQTKLDKAREDLRLVKTQYNSRYNEYFPEDGDDSRGFFCALEKYRDTELPAYIEKIEHARHEAERQFKDHFVSRLNEYILDAKESFSELNYTLRSIHFGQDRYTFTIEEKQEKKKDLAVIKDAAQVQEYNDTIFEQLNTPEQKERIERLFDSILKNDLDSFEVREICDYRQYFTYDIKIQHTKTLDKKTGKPLESYLSRVLREKSGGETQTPYYVAIAASFFRFYKDEKDAIRLVLFDEAFNKMDDERIGKIVEFLKQIGLQVVTAVPTEKIETIAPYMDRINLILRKDYTAYIRDYAILKEQMSGHDEKSV